MPPTTTPSVMSAGTTRRAVDFVRGLGGVLGSAVMGSYLESWLSRGRRTGNSRIRSIHARDKSIPHVASTSRQVRRIAPV